MESEVINWTEVLVALALRLIGVFVVLAFLMVSIQLAGSLITRARQGRPQQAAGRGHETTGDAGRDPACEASRLAPDGHLPDEETAAAIALALEALIREKAAASQIPAPAGPAPYLGDRDSSWKILGRREALLRDAPWKGPMRQRD